MTFSNEFRVKVVTDVLSGKQVNEVAKEHCVSDQSVRNWLADPQILATAMSVSKDAASQEDLKSSAPGTLTDEGALALYLLSRIEGLDCGNEISRVCRKAGAHVDEALAYGEMLDKRSKLPELALKESSKHIGKLQADVANLSKRLADQKESFKEVIRSVKKFQAT